MWRVLLGLLLAGCAYQNNQYFIGDEYLGTRYVNDPLGEEFGIDADPLIRFDAFDCVTFVETVLADGNKEKLNQIRYKNGQIDFINRNHFIEADWIKNNSGVVKNVSAKYAPTNARTVTIDKKSWFKKNHNIDTDFATQTVILEYIPYSRVQDIVIDRPMVVLFVRGDGDIKNKIGTDLAVRHMGLLMPDGRLRHASRRRGRVIDVNFLEYAHQMMENKNNLGIMLLEIKK